MRNDPIGLMDSGVGGLTVLREIQRLLPMERTVYLGDQGRLPYGPRPMTEVAQFVRQIAAFLQRTHHIKLLVIACNTATAAALPALQAELTIPVVGVIAPGARAAVQATHNHHIGVIATAGTVKSNLYQRLILAKDSRNTVDNLACPEFVTLAEANDLESRHAQTVIADRLAPLTSQGLDTLVLGCTHFPLLRSAVQAVMGPEVTLIDPGTATAQAVTALLDYWDLANDQGQLHPITEFYTTGAADRFAFLAGEWLSQPVTQVSAVPLTTLAAMTPTQTTEVN